MKTWACEKGSTEYLITATDGPIQVKFRYRFEKFDQGPSRELLFLAIETIEHALRFYRTALEMNLDEK